jgi:hypothetical protein
MCTMFAAIHAAALSSALRWFADPSTLRAGHRRKAPQIRIPDGPMCRRSDRLSLARS